MYIIGLRPLESIRIADNMSLIDRLQQDMTAAMKSRSEARLSALRMMKAALMKQKVDSPKPLDEAAEMQVLKMLVKQRTESAVMFRQAGLADIHLMRPAAGVLELVLRQTPRLHLGAHIQRHVGAGGKEVELAASD